MSHNLIITGIRPWTGEAFHTDSHDLFIDNGVIRDLKPGLDAVLPNHIPRLSGNGSLLIPAFHDAHVHFLGAGKNLLSAPIHEATDRDHLIQILQKHVSGLDRDAWVVTGGWAASQFAERTSPDSSWLDPVSETNPIMLFQYDGHSAVANTRAMELAGITADTPDPPGGQIMRDASGRPTGLLRDAAMGLIEDILPTPTENDLHSHLEAAQQTLLSNGITAVGDMLYNPHILNFLQERAADGTLKIRNNLYYPIRFWPGLRDHLATNFFRNDRFKVAGVKVFSDGSLGSLTALMDSPYAGTDSVGIYDGDWLDQQVLNDFVFDADRSGLQIAIHAIGDRANHEVLNLAEKLRQTNGSRDRRFRIEHAQHIKPEDIQRFAGLDVIASIQPGHIPGDIDTMNRLLPDRHDRAYPYRHLHEAGTRIALGTDWPVIGPDPISNLFCALNHGGFNAGQGLDMATALNAYTSGAAYAADCENEAGSLKPGMVGDVVLLDPEFEHLEHLEAPDHSLIRKTVVAGEPFHDA